MAKRKPARSLPRKILFVAAILIALVIAVPPIQVLVACVWNPTWSPMQMQREWESWRSGDKHPQEPLVWVPLNKIPPRLIHYIWASEDQNFFEHRGFDVAQIRKAMEEAKKKGNAVRGSSTITMQCARSVFLWQGRSYIRKALEAYYTFWMETLLGKRRILELYLNHIEWGPGVYGIGAAARYHFDKSPGQLTSTQMMALAAILPNPRKWSPKNPDATVARKIRRVERLSSRAPFPSRELTKN